MIKEKLFDLLPTVKVSIFVYEHIQREYPVTNKWQAKYCKPMERRGGSMLTAPTLSKGSIPTDRNDENTIFLTEPQGTFCEGYWQGASSQLKSFPMMNVAHTSTISKGWLSRWQQCPYQLDGLSKINKILWTEQWNGSPKSTGHAQENPTVYQLINNYKVGRFKNRQH